MSHSKRNTSLAFFTAHERNELRSTWGSQSTWLTRDSFLSFGSCLLCLLPARDPVSCASHGHLFCRECAVNNLLAQSKELKRLKKEAERRKLEDEEEKQLEDAEAQAKAVEEFEKLQAGLSVRSGGKASGSIVGRHDGKITIEQDIEGGGSGLKRKFEVDEDELLRLAKEGQSKIRRKDSESNGNKTELPSFWIPSETPDDKKAATKATKQQPTCPAAEEAGPAHGFSLKTLVTVNFNQDKSNNAAESNVRTCPSCNKALSNTTKAMLAKPCGHVLCKPCSEQFQKAPSKSAHNLEHDETVRCYVCQEDITAARKVKSKKDDKMDSKEKEEKVSRGLVELSSDGTGFAGGGKNMVKKSGLAFQC